MPRSQGAPSRRTALPDKNKDGKIAKDERPARHPLARHVGMLDTNRDGSLSPVAFAKHHGM